MSNKPAEPRVVSYVPEDFIFQSSEEAFEKCPKQAVALVVQLHSFDELQKENAGLKELLVELKSHLPKVPTQAYEKELAERCNELETERDELKAENERSTSIYIGQGEEIAELKKVIELWTQKNSTLQKERDALKVKYHDASVDIDRKRTIIVELHAECDKLQKEHKLEVNRLRIEPEKLKLELRDMDKYRVERDKLAAELQAAKYQIEVLKDRLADSFREADQLMAEHDKVLKQNQILTTALKQTKQEYWNRCYDGNGTVKSLTATQFDTMIDAVLAGAESLGAKCQT